VNHYVGLEPQQQGLQSAQFKENLSMKATQNVNRATLRYFGDKWAIAPWIIEYMPEHRVYVEPFCGTASALLRKPRVEPEAYNALDDEIVVFFRVLQNPYQCQKLIRLFRAVRPQKTQQLCQHSGQQP
jgi:DNA adenine methylase